MTEAKELDPAALEAAIMKLMREHFDTKTRHVLTYEQERDGIEITRVAGNMFNFCEALIEALSTAPVALGAGWNTDLDAMPHALTLLFKAHDPDEPEGVVSLGIRGEEPQRLIAWSFLPSAIHPAPSREAVIEAPPISFDFHDDGQPAWKQVIDMFQRHGLAAPDWRFRDKLVTMLEWAKYGAAIRSIPSSAPSLGEARLAEKPSYWMTPHAVAEFVAAQIDAPSHVQAEAGE